MQLFLLSPANPNSIRYIFNYKFIVMRKIILSILLCAVMMNSSAQDSTLQEYTGKYKFPPGGMIPEVDITLSNDILTITAVLGSAPLEKVSRDTFLIPSYGNAMVYFYRNAESKVNAIKIDTGNDVMEGKKEGMAAAWIREYFRKTTLEDIAKK